MKMIDNIITKVDCKYGAPMGRPNWNGSITELNKKRIYDCRVPMSACGAYDRGGAYWGIGAELRVRYTKDLSFIEFYRKEQVLAQNAGFMVVCRNNRYVVKHKKGSEAYFTTFEKAKNFIGLS